MISGIMKYLILLLIRMIYDRQRRNLDPGRLPLVLRQNFGEAMQVEIDRFIRNKFLMIPLQLLIWSRFLGKIRISESYMRYLLTRISKREKIHPIPSILPLSAVTLPKNYESLACQAVSSAQLGTVFLNRFHQFREGSTNIGLGELDTVKLHITHKSGLYEVIMSSQGVLMGRKKCSIGLKVDVVKSPLFSKEKVTVCIFHPIHQILIVGLENGTVNFYRFSDDLESITPSFTMTLIASLPFTGQTPGSVLRITANPTGSLFVIRYNSSPSVLVSMDAKNNLVTIPFVSAELSRSIGSIYSLAFFGEDRIMTTHYRKYCVWDLSDFGDIKLLSQIEPILCTVGGTSFYQGIIEQIIPCGESLFLLRTLENILLVRLGDHCTTCIVLVEMPVYGRFSPRPISDVGSDSIALFGNMLILVVPSNCIVKFFLLRDDAIQLVLTKQIETPTCWSYDPRTSIFSYYYTSWGGFTLERKFRV